MGASLGGVGFEEAVEAEAFAGGAEQGEQVDREGVDQQKAVAPLRVGDAQLAHAEAEPEVLGVAEARLDGPALGVKVGDLARWCLAVAGDEALWLLHAFGMHAHHGPRPR